ncbi:MAG: DUF3179 domain-containing protein [Acidobacteria bacterium]|nr:DUF3179 domain-containing protein [Acidobacteriota bacterium]
MMQASGFQDHGTMTRRLFLSALPALAQDSHPPLDDFYLLLIPDNTKFKETARRITAVWRDSYAVMLVELLRIYGALNPNPVIQRRLLDFLSDRTRQHFGTDLRAWTRWVWTVPYDPHPDYATFKSQFYSNIDPRMTEFFPPKAESRIRLDQIEWGGVVVNGIPPLVDPKTMPAAEAGYLKDSHVVFGIALNGEARAYPKRILAWHEMARDRVGGANLAT